MKINSISNLNFRANKTQEKHNQREYSKGDLLAMSGLAVPITGIITVIFALICF